MDKIKTEPSRVTYKWCAYPSKANVRQNTKTQNILDKKTKTQRLVQKPRLRKNHKDANRLKVKGDEKKICISYYTNQKKALKKCKSKL